MSPLEILRIAARALWANKLRSALTALGIVVGVAAVVCMASVGGGARAEVSEKIRTLGANLLLVMPGAQSSGGARLESRTRHTLTDADAAAIRGNCRIILSAFRSTRPIAASAPLLDRYCFTLNFGHGTDSSLHSHKVPSGRPAHLQQHAWNRTTPTQLPRRRGQSASNIWQIDPPACAVASFLWP